jgi:hypothetical protein
MTASETFSEAFTTLPREFYLEGSDRDSVHSSCRSLTPSLRIAR